MSLIVGRKTELAWLNRTLRVGPSALITGPVGMGKTTLVREYLKSTKIQNRWFSFSRYNSLQLIEPNFLRLSDEECLEQLSKSWQEGATLIWDDFHLLPLKTQNTICRFILHHSHDNHHILMSDEETAIDPDPRLAKLKLGPLTLDELDLFLSTFPDIAAPAHKVYSWTGGIPLLLALWIQNPVEENQDLVSVFTHLEPQERETLNRLAVLNSPLPISLAQELSGFKNEETQSLLNNLSKKHLIEISDIIQLQPFFKGPLLTGLKKWEIEKLRKLIFENSKLFSVLSWVDQLEILHSLGEKNKIHEISLLTTNEQVTILNNSDLERVATCTESDSVKESSPSTLRLYLKALFLKGDRQRALKVAQKLLKEFDQRELLKPLNAEEQNLLFDMLQLFAREREFELTQLTYRNYRDRLLEPLRTHAAMEEAATHLDKNPAQTRKRLEELTQRLRSNSELTVASHAALAMAQFQKARSEDFQDLMSEALESYRAAQFAFEKCHNIYYAAVCRLNIAWAYLNTAQLIELHKELTELEKLSARYGYRYILAGIDVIRARNYRWNLEFSRALQTAESGLQTLGVAAPGPALADALTEKCLALAGLGLRSLAKKTFEQIGAKNPRLKLLALELDHPYREIESWLDEWDTLEPGLKWSGTLFNALAERGIAIPYEQPKTLKQTRSFRLAALESQLISQLEQSEDEILWLKIGEIESLLQTITDPMPERVGILLLQSHLASPDKRGAIFDRIEMELSRASWDLEIKAIFQAWLSAIKTNSKNAPSEQSLWKKSPIGDQERWQRWWQRFWATTEEVWILKTPKKTETLKKIPSQIPKKGLWVFESLGDVRWNGKKLNKFIRSHSLRKLLILMIDKYPDTTTKELITTRIWQESYRPQIHDARIYTAIQRIRDELKKEDCIQNWAEGYRWNPHYTFSLVTSHDAKQAGVNRLQSLILSALEGAIAQGKNWLSRSQILEITGGSEATLKRELSKLVAKSYLTRRGAGRSVEYSRVGTKV